MYVEICQERCLIYNLIKSPIFVNAIHTLGAVKLICLIGLDGTTEQYKYDNNFKYENAIKNRIQGVIYAAREMLQSCECIFIYLCDHEQSPNNGEKVTYCISIKNCFLLFTTLIPLPMSQFGKMPTYQLSDCQ